MKTKLIRIGNSRGVRIPRSLLQEVNLGEQFEMVAVRDEIILRPSRLPRAGWEDQFRAMAAQRDDRLVDKAAEAPTEFDRGEWEW
ncbi:MAG TPA: AbrB/MazE/SpoVT family DNA-binding domain-containing protein [bacterium]